MHLNLSVSLDSSLDWTIPSLFTTSSLVCCTGMVKLSAVSILAGAEAKDAPSKVFFLLGASAKGEAHTYCMQSSDGKSLHAILPCWHFDWNEASQLLSSGSQYFSSISMAIRFSPTLGTFSASTRCFQEGERSLLIQQSSVSRSWSIESFVFFSMILSWNVGTSNCTPMLYHLWHTECSALMAAFSVSAGKHRIQFVMPFI